VTMAAILEMDGYSVATALRADDALRQIAAEEFDLVLTDLRLDDYDGMDVLAAARRRSTETVGIVLTGYASLESAVKALREGAYDYMLKPADVEELRATVARGIERRRLGEQLRARVADLEAANRTINELNEGLQDRIAHATAELQARIRDLDETRQELQASYEKLQELDKLKSQFLSIASHELKTPITAMSGFVQIAVRRIKRRLGAGRPNEADWKKEEETLLEQLEVVQRQTTKLARLVDELLDVSRIESGRLELRLADVDLPELIAEVMRRHQLMATKHELRLHYDPEQKLSVRGDRDHLEQVLNNLIGNAMKYSPDGGAIDVTVTRAGEHEVEFAVADHGIGIRPEELARVFGLFYRSPDRLARDVGGMGLGLYITKEIVDRHTGRIWAESEVEKGTNFHVALPASVPAAVEA
jgi:signal transduction histidine kinase